MKTVKGVDGVTIHYVSYDKAKFDKMRQLYGQTQKVSDESSEQNTATNFYYSGSQPVMTKHDFENK